MVNTSQLFGGKLEGPTIIAVRKGGSLLIRSLQDTMLLRGNDTNTGLSLGSKFRSNFYTNFVPGSRIRGVEVNGSGCRAWED